MVDIEAFLKAQRIDVEHNAVETERIWTELLSKLQTHKQDLIKWNSVTVDDYDGWGTEQKVIEKKAFTALIEMTSQQVGQLVRDYYIATRDSSHTDGLWNPTIEAQIHYINNICDRVRQQKW